MKYYQILIAAISIALTASSLWGQTRDYGYAFTTPGTLATDTASWNFTLDTSYSGSGDPGTTANMLIVRGESGGSDHSIVSQASETAYFVRTVNTQNANFGFYLMNLDFTDIDSGVDLLVSYSFDILANDTNDSINPNDWNVRYTTGTTGVGVSAYTNLAQTFSFQDDGTTWTNITGSFNISTGTGSSRGGVLINAGTSGSGFTSAGGYYLADYDVQVTSVPESSMYAILSGLSVCLFVVSRRHRFKA